MCSTIGSLHPAIITGKNQHVCLKCSIIVCADWIRAKNGWPSGFPLLIDSSIVVVIIAILIRDHVNGKRFLVFKTPENVEYINEIISSDVARYIGTLISARPLLSLLCLLADYLALTSSVKIFPGLKYTPYLFTNVLE